MENQLLMLLQNQTSSGSGRGLSYFKRVMRCGALAQILQENPGLDKGSEGKRVGAHLHTLCELYHGRELSSLYTSGVLDATPDPLSLDEELKEVFRVFRAYTRQVGVGEWGAPLAVERHMPANEVESAALLASGLGGITGRLDLLVDVSQADADRILDRWNLFLLPGRYIVDYKFMASKQQAFLLDHEQGIQFNLYPMMMTSIDHSTPILGTIVVRVYKYKETKSNPGGPVIEPILVLAPNAEKRTMVNKWVELAHKREREEYGIANPGACFSDGVCPVFFSGLCSRGGSQDVETEAQGTHPAV